MWVPERRQQQNSTTYSTSRGRKIPVRWYLLQNNMIRWYTVCTLTFMPCQNIYCLTALCLYSGQCFALSLLKERFCECLVVFIFLFYLKIITRVKTVWNQPGSSLESAVKNKIWTFQTKNWMLIEAVKTWILSNDQQGVTPIVYESFETWP